MAGELDGKTVAFIAADGVEQVELTEPWKAVEEAGGTPELISIQEGEIQGFEHLDKADTFQAKRAASEADVDDYDGLVLPGGVANPDFLRADEDVVGFIRRFFEEGKPVAAICHGPWTLVEADNAGGEWVDEEVHVDGGLVTSRNPDDLPAFCDKLVEEVAEGRHDRQAESAGAGAG